LPGNVGATPGGSSGASAMSTYRKFSDARQVEAPTLAPPKPAKAPTAVPCESNGLGSLGALGGDEVHIPDLAPLAAKLDCAGGTWGEPEAERAAVVEYECNIPRDWAEGFARLHPNHSPADVPPRRWLAFINDCRRFLEGGFAAKAAALGWGPFDVFGCDRDRPFARINQAGLLWLLNGDSVIALSENTATVETRNGARQTWRRKPNEPGRTLPWELAAGVDK
jgi:hypothetical protein